MCDVMLRMERESKKKRTKYWPRLKKLLLTSVLRVWKDREDCFFPFWDSIPLLSLCGRVQHSAHPFFFISFVPFKKIRQRHHLKTALFCNNTRSHSSAHLRVIHSSLSHTHTQVRNTSQQSNSCSFSIAMLRDTTNNLVVSF